MLYMRMLENMSQILSTFAITRHAVGKSAISSTFFGYIHSVRVSSNFLFFIATILLLLGVSITAAFVIKKIRNKRKK